MSPPMASYQRILREVLRHILPRRSEKQRLLGMAQRALQIVSEVAKPYHGKAMLAGSLTRGTWLPTKMEFEIFVLFPPSLSKRRLGQYILEIGAKAMERLGGGYKVEYAEHPYVAGFVGGIGIDIVPCYEVASTRELKSAVDRTPFHVRWLDEHLPPALTDEVRLLKHFLSVNHIYGADARVEGFSGYVCEILVTHYGKFIDILRAVSEWRPGQVVDVEGYYTERDWPRLRRKFRGHPLILIDPTDPTRNAAAAVSANSFYRFKSLAKQFLKRPSPTLFTERYTKPLSERELRSRLTDRGTELLVVKFTPPPVVPDILWPQLRKLADRLHTILEEVKYEFKVLRRDVWTDEADVAVVLLEMEISRLPPVQKRTGPPIFNLDDSVRFIKKWRGQALAGPYIEDNCWCVEIRRRWLTAADKLADSLSKPADVLKAKGIPGFVADQIAQGVDILAGSGQIARLMADKPEFGVFLRKYFERRISDIF